MGYKANAKYNMHSFQLTFFSYFTFNYVWQRKDKQTKRKTKRIIIPDILAAAKVQMYNKRLDKFSMTYPFTKKQQHIKASITLNFYREIMSKMIWVLSLITFL